MSPEGPSGRISRRALLGLGATGAAALSASCAADLLLNDGVSPTPPASPPTPRSTPRGWTTVWEENFGGPGRNADAAGLDPDVWTAADYGGNQDLGELQYNSPAQVSVEDGNLVLKARQQETRGYSFVAGSVSSKGKLAVGPYGRLTTRQLLSSGGGLGFGVCLYGKDIDSVGWPSCGEIDATEIALARPTAPFASVHGPGYAGGSPISTIGEVPSLVDRWAEHVLEWDAEGITWSIDGSVYAVAERGDPRAAAGWPFDGPFFITIVLTVGSGLSGPVDQATWPRSVDGAAVDPYMVVDFLRFEQRA